MYFLRPLESWTWPLPKSRSTNITPSQRVESLLYSIYLEIDKQLLSVQGYFSLRTSGTQQSRKSTCPGVIWNVLHRLSYHEPVKSYQPQAEDGESTAALPPPPSAPHRSSRDTGPEGHGGGSPSPPPRPAPGDTRDRHQHPASRAGSALPHLDADLVGGEAAAAHPHCLRVAHVDLQEVAGRPVGVVKVLRLADQPPGVCDRLGHGGAGAFSPEPATEPRAPLPLPPPPAPPDRPPCAQLTDRQRAPVSAARSHSQGTLGNVVFEGCLACSCLARPPVFWTTRPGGR